MTPRAPRAGRAPALSPLLLIATCHLPVLRCIVDKLHTYAASILRARSAGRVGGVEVANLKRSAPATLAAASLPVRYHSEHHGDAICPSRASPSRGRSACHRRTVCSTKLCVCQNGLVVERTLTAGADHASVLDHVRAVLPSRPADEWQYEKPRNVGSMDKLDPNVGTGLVGAPACGDVMSASRVDCYFVG